MNPPANFESLPQELKDLIMEHIPQIKSKSERIRALSSIALVSRRFRYCAHKRLFAAVAFRGRSDTTLAAAFRRLSRLKDLITADPHSEMTGIASHIRSFTLRLGGRLSLVLPSLVEGEALPFILRTIFRNGNRPSYLSIILFVPVNGDRLDWMALGHDFRCALLDIVCSARLSTLYLLGISNLPDDILTCSAVDHISFKNITIQHYMQSDRVVSNSEPPSCIQPYSIETDHSFPITHILDLTPMHSQPWDFIFQRLRRLTIKINDPEDFTKSTELLKSATGVENLEIKLNCRSRDRTEDSATSSRAALSFRPLHVLRHLSLVHRRQTSGHVSSNGHTHGTIQDMIDLLGYSQLPRSLCSISINLPLIPFYGGCFYPETPSRDPADQDSTDSETDGINPDQSMKQVGGAGTPGASGVVGDGVLLQSGNPVTSATSSIPSTVTIIKRIFAPWSRENTIFRPLDDLLGDSSIESQDRFAGIRYLTFRLELEVYRVPRKYSMKQELAEEAARYVKSEFFPKTKERFERGDRSSGGFWVVVVPKFHRLR